jgi:RNA polymerase sigma factor (sigma-70 family)
MDASSVRPTAASSITTTQQRRNAQVIGQRERLDRLYRGYRRFAERILRQAGVDASWTEDALQDVFLVVVSRSEQQSARGGAFASWLAGVCRNVANAYRRQRSRWACYDSGIETEADLGRSPEDVYALRQAQALLEGFLTELDPKKRAVFELAELNDLPGPLAASSLGINVHTAYARLRVARASFARRVHTLQMREARLAS